MTCYRFHLRGPARPADQVQMPYIDSDGAAFEAAGRLLDQHPICESIEVWAGERPVAVRFREQPILRPLILN